MKIKLGRMLFFLCSFPLVFWNCTDTFWFTEVNMEVEHENFTLQEAREFFNESTMQLAVVSRSMQDDGKTRLSAGEFTPDWDNSVSSAKNDLMCYDVPIDCEHTYKAVMLTKESKAPTLDAVDVYQKLVVVKSRTTGEMGQYLLTLVPDIEYERQHQGEVADLFINAGDKGGFSGVAIYSVPGLDLIVRANRYTNGTKTRGVHLSGDKKEMKEKIFWLKSVLRPFQLYRSSVVQSRNVSENIILQIIKDYNNLIKVDDYWIYVDENGEEYRLLDEDGDGIPETFWVLPDTGGEENTGPTPDPDPEPEEDPFLRCPRCGRISCDGNCVTSGGGSSGGNSGEGTILSNVKIGYSVGEYPGYIKGVRDCKGVADMLMRQILGENAYIGSSDNVIQLYKEVSVNGVTTLVLVGDANQVFDALNSHLDAGRPITVGVNHRLDLGINNDKTTDHFVVIYSRGYDTEKGQYYFNYIETARGKSKATEAYANDVRLYYNPNDKSFKGGTWLPNRNYDLVQIRPNNNR